MLPNSAGVEPATSWSPVGRRIQLSHRGRQTYIVFMWSVYGNWFNIKKKGKRKVQGVPQSQTAAIPRPQEEEETDKSKQTQIKKTYEKH